MATHPQGKNTKNLSVNLPEVAKSAFGRLAYVRGKYSGELVRELIREQLEVAAVKGEIVREVALEAIEALKKPKTLGLILIGFLSLCGGLPRRARRVSRSRPALVAMARTHRKVDGDGWEAFA